LIATAISVAYRTAFNAAGEKSVATIIVFILKYLIVKITK